MVDLHGKTLYEALGVAKDASKAEIRKSYHKLALQLHPDKNLGDATATEKFATLQKVYGILSNEDKRKVYDQTGSIEDSEELAGEKFNELYEYYRSMYAKVTEDDLKEFHASFRGGEEERGDVLKYYQQFKGDMRMVFEWVMCSEEAADSHRFMDLLDAAINAKDVPSYPKYTAWAKRVAARPRPMAPAAGAAPKLKAAGGKGRRRQQGAAAEAALVAQIRGRQQQAFGGLLSDMAARYGGGAAAGAGLENDIPSEEDFQAARQRLEQRKSGGGSTAAAAASGNKQGGGSKKGKQRAEPAAESAAEGGGSGGKRSKKK